MKKKKIISGEGEKIILGGLPIWDSWVLPCKSNTQQEGSAFLTDSQWIQEVPAAGGEWVGALAEGERQATVAGSRAVNPEHWDGRPHLTLVVELYQSVSSELRAMLMLKLNTWEMIFFLKGTFSDLFSEC
jgi:hypothetical protein